MKSNPFFRGSRSLRKGRVSLPGQIYLVTAVCDERRTNFGNWSTASCVAAVLANARLWRRNSLLSWVLMPDHLHALVQLGDDESLSHLMQRVKAVTAHTAKEAGCQHQVWMRGFHDRALRRDEDVVKVARYILANPLRAGLCVAVADYPYWDATWLDGDLAEP